MGLTNRKPDLLERLHLFEDSREVAEAVKAFRGVYWPGEASTHILGLWDLANDLADEVRRLRGKA